MIDIKGDNGGLLVDFLVDFKAYDPKNIGVLQLALNQKSFQKLHSITAESIPKQAQPPLASTLVNLRSIWAACLLHCGARTMIGFLSGTRNYETKLNRSMPIFSFAPEFELLESDPRAIEPDLGRTTVFRHPKRMKEAWEYFEKCVFGGKYDQPLQRTFSYVMAELTTSPVMVADKGTMKEYLSVEAERWAANATFLCYDWWVEPEDRKSILSAAGMWLFPGDTFDKLIGNEDGKLVANLKGCKPGLLVARLA
ncbi:hypothetical protein B0I35DRAFT_444712 [Stachybotrys elegans]|uniref:Uncharacterized protein n=1 Tax=Stachybotrys elegans TaxID=80388 RepID=A0A8K0SFQ2_9HYPO|nr:hypothetical protein B0I35DRAFT_444712 [Stachybotrys elegans]